ncbi:DNA/RNA non-specific endonuclease [Mycolicibacterium goodii]|uniref:DNA/RNA non-specific endonuclease n=1 Tax=Mycolicibacterium goodii TaxID=134601 RepID=UPI001F0375FD|nr:DNA/RNA non-specific endonuclease [Mycolicibacterium goodii]ULN45212.1 DNA/RNA non-specific endonuclease [Mycolicibacterium goodii]
MGDVLEKLRGRNRQIQRRDSVLSAELARARDAVTVDVGAGPMILPSRDGDSIDIEEESIIMRTGRPVLAILRNETQLRIDDPDSEVWTKRLTKVKAHLISAAEAVGRIEVDGHSMSWLGTGWLIAPDVIVTNRHVAAEFGRQVGTEFVFRRGLEGADMTASIDFLEEIDRPDEWSFRLERILHIEDAGGPDIAFCRVARTGGDRLPNPIMVAPVTDEAELVAVIGYPARDSRIPEQPLMDRIYGDVYDKKRLAPGQLTGSAHDVIRHDCSTLGGNSGSVVLSLDTGEAVGLHYAGRFLQANFAVRGSVVARRLEHVLHGTPVAVAGPRNPETARPAQLTYVVPIRITVEVDGMPQPDQAPPTDDAIANHGAGADTDEVFTAAVAADYADREGYADNFLGDGPVIPLPEAVGGADDVLQFPDNGGTSHVLRYEHFSVVMSRRRRLCRFSAVNIDGATSVSRRRTSWRTDPRIPATAQISRECYGDPPKFSRGHMTRREDPVWGSDQAAERGNTDSMHVTNAVPQMQPFNGGVWLDLENYALQNARRDDMRISVFTGPFLFDDDPVMFDVKVPVEFWKVIAFIHDDTGRLCATGYTMSQRDFLGDEEFVFGQHETTQTSIASIEQRSGLSFGELSAHDPLDEIELATLSLTDVRQIRFV